MRFFRPLFITLLAVASLPVAGQTLYRGIVVDSASFAPLPYVNIQIKNTLRGTSSDIKGNFSIQATANDTLLLSMVGYESLLIPLNDYEAGLIRLVERETVLPTVDIVDNRTYENPYENMFDEENAKIKKKIPFYYHRIRKDKVKAQRWRDESARVQTYINVVINDPQTRINLMNQYSLSEKEYYDLLTKFNERHFEVMYFLTEGELRSLINKFFEAHVK